MDNLDRDERENLMVRPVLPSDSNQLLKWRNHELVRRFSKNSSLILEIDHENWFKHKLDPKNSTHRIFIFQEDLTLVGMSRLDVNEKSKGEISIIVDPGLFSRGYGASILKQTIQIGFREASLTNLIAVIHNDNHASIALFTKNGFKELERGQVFSTYSLFKQEISN